MGIEKIEYNAIVLAFVIRSSYHNNGIEFFTPTDFPQQLGYMNRPAGYIVEPRVLALVDRGPTIAQKVLFIKSGKVRVDIFDEEREYLESRVLVSGDVILFASGAHGVEVLEQAEIIEVKQGPYSSLEDVGRFSHIPENPNIKQ